MRWSTSPYAPRLLAAGLLLLSSFTPLAAQSTGVIRGKVTEAGTGRPVPEARVTITGRQQGAVTSASGDYVIPSVPAGTVELLARRIGYGRSTRTVTVTAGVETRADFTISMTASVLDAVIVTGTGGNAEKRSLGNSITQLDVADLTSKTSVLNVTEVLQGKTPGVTILPGSGVPGHRGEIRIRGASSISGYKPVVFIDGIRYNIDDLGSFSATGGGTAGLAQSTQVTSALNNLNPNDIESIEIIKGPAAATLYGAEAANGVIQIITKKGTRGQQALRWNVRGGDGQQHDGSCFQPDNYTTCDAASRRRPCRTTDTTQVWPGCQGVAGQHDHHRQPARRVMSARSGLATSCDTPVNVRGGGDRYSFYLVRRSRHRAGRLLQQRQQPNVDPHQLQVQPEREVGFRRST